MWKKMFMRQVLDRLNKKYCGNRDLFMWAFWVPYSLEKWPFCKIIFHYKNPAWMTTFKSTKCLLGDKGMKEGTIVVYCWRVFYYYYYLLVIMYKLLFLVMVSLFTCVIKLCEWWKSIMWWMLRMLMFFFQFVLWPLQHMGLWINSIPISFSSMAALDKKV